MVDSKKRPGKDLDRIDRNILNELQKDGRISNVELSKRVGLSPTPCLERVRRLERQGFIQGYTALLNPHYLDASLLVFVLGHLLSQRVVSRKLMPAVWLN